jgi:tRNA(Ile)-lysidine synthetase-like protein
VGAVALLPGGLRLRVDYENVVVEPAKAKRDARGFALDNNAELTLPVPGVVTGEGWRLELSLTPLDGAQASLAIPDGSALTLRARRAGDVWQPLGLGGHSKLSRWMINHKIPQFLRDTVPLVIVDGSIVAVAYGETWAIAGQVRRQNAAGRTIWLRWTKA